MGTNQLGPKNSRGQIMIVEGDKFHLEPNVAEEVKFIQGSNVSKGSSTSWGQS